MLGAKVPFDPSIIKQCFFIQCLRRIAVLLFVFCQLIINDAPPDSKCQTDKSQKQAECDRPAVRRVFIEGGEPGDDTDDPRKEHVIDVEKQ